MTPVPRTAVAEIAAELDRLCTAGPGPAVPALFVGCHQVPGDMRLADSPIMDGCVVSLGDPAGCRRPEPAGVAELRVASGPPAGSLYRLAFGRATSAAGPGDAVIAESADIVIADPAIPPLALRVMVDPRGCQVAPFDGVPVLLDRRPLDSSRVLAARPADRRRRDAARPGAVRAAGRRAAPGRRRHRPGVQPPAAAAAARRHATRFQLPSPPGKPERRPVPILMAVVPVVLGVAMAYFLRQVYMLAMAAFSPVMLLGSYVSDRRHGRKSHARQQAEYREHKARIERDARAAVDAERLRRRHDCPDPATVLSIASGPRRRLWERRRTDPDYLLLRRRHRRPAVGGGADRPDRR